MENIKFSVEDNQERYLFTIFSFKLLLMCLKFHRTAADEVPWCVLTYTEACVVVQYCTVYPQDMKCNAVSCCEQSVPLQHSRGLLKSRVLSVTLGEACHWRLPLQHLLLSHRSEISSLWN